MSSICVVHGVGFFHEQVRGKIKAFMTEVEKRTGADCLYYTWQHSGKFPPDDRNSMFFKEIRDFTFEIIMDFAYVIEHLEELGKNLPDADMYVGHSAGGVIVSQKTDKPQVLFGCPVQLVRNVRLQAKEADILNLMHYRDPIAAATTAVNKIVHDPLITPIFNPVKAHTGYWESEEVIKEVTNWFKSHVEE